LVVLTGDLRIGAAGAYRLGLNEVSIGMPVPVLAMELARDRLSAAELPRATRRLPRRGRAGGRRARAREGRGRAARRARAQRLSRDEVAAARQDDRAR